MIFNPISYYNKVKPLMGSTINPFHRLSQGLIGFWPFLVGTSDNSNADIARDVSGNENHATVTGTNTGTWKPSNFSGYALNVSGNFDYLDLPSSGSTANDHYMQEGIPFTLSWWIFPLNTTDADLSRITLKIGDNTPNASLNTFQLVYADGEFDNEFAWGAKDNSSAMKASDVTNLNDRLNTWTHYVLTGPDPVETATTNFTFYENAISQVITFFSGGIGVGMDFQNRFGDSNNQPSADAYFDLIMIYNRQLSATEVSELFNRPFQMFNDPFNSAIVQAGGLIDHTLVLPRHTEKLKGLYRY